MCVAGACVWICVRFCEYYSVAVIVRLNWTKSKLKFIVFLLAEHFMASKPESSRNKIEKNNSKSCLFWKKQTPNRLSCFDSAFSCLFVCLCVRVLFSLDDGNEMCFFLCVRWSVKQEKEMYVNRGWCLRIALEPIIIFRVMRRWCTCARKKNGFYFFNKNYSVSFCSTTK